MGVLVSEGGQGRWTSGNLGRASAGPGGLLHSPAAAFGLQGASFPRRQGFLVHRPLSLGGRRNSAALAWCLPFGLWAEVFGRETAEVLGRLREREARAQGTGHSARPAA